MSQRLAMVLADLARGGIGKMRVHLANEFVRRGVAVDLLLARTDSPYLNLLDPGVRVINLGTSHFLSGIPPLARYLRREKPDVVLTQRIRVNIVTLRARWLAGRSEIPVYSTLNTNLTAQLDSLQPAKRDKQLAQMRRFYPRNDGLIAVSGGVADDAARLLDIPRQRIQVIYNPTATPSLLEQARQPLEHPWFEAGQPPVILGVGRLEPQKDFPTLIRAFARLRQTRPCRLLILGEGQLRPDLLALAGELGVADDVQLPGFQDNPYAFMGRAALFVLASRWEGLPNALTEALAVGTPVVATNCPNGPDEILEGGRHGPLVPMGDPQALAEAMGRTLDHPPAADELRRAAGRFTPAVSAGHYLQAMHLQS